MIDIVCPLSREKLTPFREQKKRARLANEIYSSAFLCFEEDLKRNVEALLPAVLEGRLAPFDAGNIVGQSVRIEPVREPGTRS